jgi:hypothetical protein
MYLSFFQIDENEFHIFLGRDQIGVYTKCSEGNHHAILSNDKGIVLEYSSRSFNKLMDYLYNK